MGNHIFKFGFLSSLNCFSYIYGCEPFDKNRKMKTAFSQYIKDYTKQLESENVRKGYRGLIGYLMDLRTHFMKKYPAEFSVGSFYQGYMDMSYFPIVPPALKSQKLKIGLVFNHEKIQFEIYLLGQNKQVQKRHWDWFKENEHNKYQISKTAQNSVIEHVLVEQPDFTQLNSLTEKIETGALEFIKDISDVFS